MLRTQRIAAAVVPLAFAASSVLIGVTAAPAASTTDVLDGASAVLQRPDFNGDGVADLAVGVPFEDLSVSYEGAVNVIYGSSVGLSETDNQFWSQDSAGILGEAVAGEVFGSALGWADFDADGYDDLAVGVWGEYDDGETGYAAGGVNVIYGSPAGLSWRGNQLWTQDSPGVRGRSYPGDQFGFAVLGQDLNGDGFADLVVGAPADGLREQGAVHVLYGSAEGLSAEGDQQFRQLTGNSQQGDFFGAALASGDFDGDGFSDLAIGVTYEDPAGFYNAGAVNVMYGSADGLTEDGNQFWHQGKPGVLGEPSEGEELGESLSAADFNGDGFADLVAGIRLDDVGGADGAGGAMVLYGSPKGLSSTGDQLWSQDSPGIIEMAEPGDTAGDVAGGDFNADGFADLALGFPNEEVTFVEAAGAVNVIYGTGSGLSATGNQYWNQNTSDIEDANEENDRFGAALGCADFDGDGYVDLVAGVPGEDHGVGTESAGSANVLYGAARGLSATGNQEWNQDKTGILDEGEAGDYFGASFAVC